MKTVVVLPTYNEAENLPAIVEALLALNVNGLEILVVDDHSPDGTGEIADALASRHAGRVHVLHQDNKRGLGKAYLAGFRWALAQGADYIIEMDADFSHDPGYVPYLVEQMQHYDVVVGSRYAPGGGINGQWSIWRRLLSRGGNLYARSIAGLAVKDTTAGFKCFRRHVLESLDLATIQSDGYAFQIEIALACQRKGYRVKEVPITFMERRAGESKLSGRIVVEAMWRVWQIRLQVADSRWQIAGDHQPWAANALVGRRWPSAISARLSGIVFLAALILYVLTLAPTVLWGDFGGYVIRAYTGDIPAHELVHPLWLYVIRPFLLLPVGDVAYRVNLSSAVFGALTLVFVFKVIVYLTRSTAAGLLGALALAISHTFWTYSVVPKTYTLNTLVLAASIYLLLRWREEGQGWYLWTVALALGLSGTNHLVMFTALPGFLLFVLLNARRLGLSHLLGQCLVAGLLFVLGFVPYGLLMLRDAAASSGGVPADPVQILLALTSSPRHYLQEFLSLFTTPGVLAFQVAVWIGALGYQFFFALIPGLLGFWRLFRKDRSLAMMLALNYFGVVAFVLAPPPPGPIMQHWHLFITSYIVVAIWIGVGFDALKSKVAESPGARLGTSGFRLRAALLALIILPPLVTYAFIPSLVKPYTGLLGVRNLPYRDTATFLFQPWKQGEMGARRFAEEVLDGLPARSVVFSDWTPYAPLKYLQVTESRRADVTLVEMPYRGEQMRAILPYLNTDRELFIADNTSNYYDIEEMAKFFRIDPWGPIYRLVRKAGAS